MQVAEGIKIRFAIASGSKGVYMRVGSEAEVL
jgi:hypothetical protein